MEHHLIDRGNVPIRYISVVRDFNQQPNPQAGDRAVSFSPFIDVYHRTQGLLIPPNSFFNL